MSEFQVYYLGCGSATPTVRHLPSCQVLNFRGSLHMIDCGEGAQLQFRRNKLKFSRLNHIYVSHIHGDHFLGLPGLLSTMALHNIGGKVVVHVFDEGAEILDHLMRVFCRETSFEIEYDVIKPEDALILDAKALTVETFPLDHRVPAVGFLFKEKQGPRHLNGEMARFLQIPPSLIPGIINDGNDFVRPDGTVVPNERITTAPTPARSYAYCSDTLYMPSLGERLRGVNTIYHEATYMSDNTHKAVARGHSTAAQAAAVAQAAGAQRLVLGHYSQAYNADEPFAHEAATIFAGEVIAAHEGLKIDI
ncbi:MAG: ribonuclease Z [Muribaculaceae bacterium]